MSELSIHYSSIATVYLNGQWIVLRNDTVHAKYSFSHIGILYRGLNDVSSLIYSRSVNRLIMKEIRYF